MSGENGENLEAFTRRQRLFIQWLATSRYERIPPTQITLADELGVHTNTLSRWKKKPGLLDAATAVARRMIKDRLPEVYAALRREAESGSYQHIKLLLELCGEHVDKQAVDVTTKGESLNEQRHPDEDRAEAMVSILDAFGTGLLRPDSRGNGSMDTEKQTAGSGAVPSSR